MMLYVPSSAYLCSECRIMEHKKDNGVSSNPRKDK